MSIIDTLITDRSAADLSALRSLLAIPFAQWTEEQKEQFKLAVSKGAYNASDLNRVTDACEYLAARLRGYGYGVNVKRPLIEETVVTPSESVLPEGYTELAWIESTGTQYIDTGFKPNQNTRVIFWGANNSTASRWFYGTWDSQGSNMFCSWYTGFWYGANSVSVSNVGTGELTIDQNKNTYNINGVSGTFTEQAFSCSYPLYLFKINAGGSPSSASLYGKLYSCQIYDNGTLVRDYVPCIDPDEEVGLYDIVNRVFYGNAGSGTFVAGPKIVKLPEGYKRVEYIESSGTQYVDTRFNPDQDTRILADVEFVEFPSAHSAVFGAYDSINAFWVYYRYSDGQYRAVNGGSTQKSIAYADPTARTTLDLQRGKFNVGENEVAFSETNFSVAWNIYLFAQNRSGTAYYPAACRMYSCQIYDNGILVRDFVPCLNPNEEVGLYDILNGVFYPNAGTGVFIAGEEVSGRGSGSKTENIIRDYWKVGDIPQRSHMEDYLQNVSVLRDAFRQATSTPAVPADMEQLTLREANEIEVILIAVDIAITSLALVFVRSAQAFSFSGFVMYPKHNTTL